MIHVLLMSVYKNEENKDFHKELYHQIAQIFGSESITPMALVRLYMRNKRPIAKKQLDALGKKLSKYNLRKNLEEFFLPFIYRN